MSLWSDCQGASHIGPLSADPWRVVEAQHILSARDLVDSNDEHDLLESMLEDSKPDVEKEKGYLIFTPFRYPPLKYGSRFGSICEPSLWYGSLELETAFAETAHYRRLFLQDTAADLGYIELTLTAFRSHVQTGKGMDLTSPAFASCTRQLSSKNTWKDSQAAGADMREAGVAAFLYYSARQEGEGKNLAVFTPDAFCMKNQQYVSNLQNWQCIANRQVVEFARTGIVGEKRYHFKEASRLDSLIAV